MLVFSCLFHVDRQCEKKKKKKLQGELNSSTRYQEALASFCCLVLRDQREQMRAVFVLENLFQLS